MKSLLVTGGSGMVGEAMKKEIPGAAFPTSKKMNLLDIDSTYDYLSKNNFDSVIHLAAKVGGVKANTDYVGDFYCDNTKINTNLLENCMKTGVSKVVSILSTCVYPDSVTYPLTEDQLHLGPPHTSNFGYAYSKRMLDVQSRAYRRQYGCNYVCAIPNNLYGENDNFHLEDSHVIPALIRKVYEAKVNNLPEVEVWGDGTPLREFTYSGDVAKILLFLEKNYDGSEPINIGYTKEYSIKQVIGYICEHFEYSGRIVLNKAMPNGQYRKPSSNLNLIDLGWDPNNYTSLEDGLKKTCNWFTINYPNIRGIN
jgi:GDP-L-fucose synthase